MGADEPQLSASSITDDELDGLLARIAHLEGVRDRAKETVRHLSGRYEELSKRYEDLERSARHAETRNRLNPT